MAGWVFDVALARQVYFSTTLLNGNRKAFKRREKQRDSSVYLPTTCNLFTAPNHLIVGITSRKELQHFMTVVFSSRVMASEKELNCLKLYVVSFFGYFILKNCYIRLCFPPVLDSQVFSCREANCGNNGTQTVVTGEFHTHISICRAKCWHIALNCC